MPGSREGGLWNHGVGWSNGQSVGALGNSLEGGQWSDRTCLLGKVESTRVASLTGEKTGVGRGRVGGRSGECPQEEEGAGGAPRLPAQGSCDSTPPSVQCGQPGCSWES